MQDYFLTIKKTSESLYKEKGSKFIGVALRVRDEEEVKQALEALRKQYYDARHHCYAYILGKDGKQTRANDDGEPNHSAGDPILGQIKSKNLTQTLVVVIRYFGGTKLGVSGLITAYKTAAQDAIEANEIIKVDVTDKATFTFAYDQMNEVMKLVKDLDLKVTNQSYHEACVLDAEVLISKTEQLENKVKFLNDTGHEIGLEIE